MYIFLYLAMLQMASYLGSRSQQKMGQSKKHLVMDGSLRCKFVLEAADVFTPYFEDFAIDRQIPHFVPEIENVLYHYFEGFNMNRWIAQFVLDLKASIWCKNGRRRKKLEGQQ